METIEDKIYRLIDEHKESELKDIVGENIQLETLVRDILFIKNGFKGLSVDTMTIKLQDYENELQAVEDVLVKSRKMDAVSTLSESLQSFEQENFTEHVDLKPEGKVTRLKPWYKYAAAASVILVLSIGLLRNMNSQFDLDHYYIEAASMSTRSNAKNSEILSLAESEKWTALASNSNQESLTILEQYYLGIALMHTGEHRKSIEYLDAVVMSRLPEYEELALYHKMINLYILDDSKYQKIQAMFLRNPGSRFYRKSESLDD